ncbi:hypothetical protein E8E13_001623 [Curvularia kusanoi]|uniref:Uncharacterized protein n=1 Tax=Curvularia kusanoi TaxID=90978 RepID=A0A9P4T6G2_CURKU|nr:hypothetical protein E8E13_001623 [Curvularia kusanoi]
MESIEEPLQSISEGRIAPQDHDAMQEFPFESETHDRNSISKVADRDHNNIFMKKQASKPSPSYPRDCQGAHGAVQAEDPGIQSLQQHHEQATERKLVRAKTTSGPRSALQSNGGDAISYYPSFRRPSFARAETSYTKPTKASRGWQTAKPQDSPVALSFWKPPGSSRPESPHQSRPSTAHQPRPGTAHQLRPKTAHPSVAPRINDQTKIFPHEKGDHGFQLPRQSPLMHEDKILQDDMCEDNQPLESDKTEATRPDSKAVRLMDNLHDNPQTVHFDKISKDIVEHPQDETDSVSTRPDESPPPSHEDLLVLKSALLTLSTAYTTACSAANIPHPSIISFQSLLSNPSQIDSATRTAFHQELSTNALHTWISEAQTRLQHPEHSRETTALHAFIAEHSLPLETAPQTLLASSQRRYRHRRVYQDDSASRGPRRPTYVDRAVQWKPVPESVSQLKERLRIQREREEADEALKEKVRDMRIGSLGLGRGTRKGGGGSEFGGRYHVEERTWFVRWRGDAYWERLTEEEKGRADRL